MDVVNAQEAAALAGCTERTIRAWIGQGKLPAQKVSREWAIDRAELAKMAGERVLASGRRSGSLGSAQAPVRGAGGASGQGMLLEALLMRIAALEERVAYLEHSRRNLQAPDLALSANLGQHARQDPLVPADWVRLAEFTEAHKVNRRTTLDRIHDGHLAAHKVNGIRYLSPEEQAAMIRYWDSKTVGRQGWKGYVRCSGCPHG